MSRNNGLGVAGDLEKLHIHLQHCFSYAELERRTDFIV
jgi:hypothetical protein